MRTGIKVLSTQSRLFLSGVFVLSYNMVTNVNISKKQRKGTLDASWIYEFIEGRSHNSQLVLKMACLREHRFIYIAIIVKIASLEALNRPHRVSRETVWIKTCKESGES